MNKVILMGRLTRDPDVRYSQGENPTAVARYSLAVDRRFSKNEENSTDFINIVAFGKAGEFAEKYLHKGTKVLVTGRIQTGSYTNKEGQKVYTTDVVAEDQEFCESKNAASANGSFGNGGDSSDGSTAGDGDFMKFDSSTDSTLPF
ncbi:MAG: single-stranded DNA-binding protein [Lachnospiraceae bacterium]|jgi:single stranded DNA-binding protein (ssb)|nr:single-stranded DNA-binding protein [Lachnospiraceae bacterium]MBR3636591.1 single-stranded DNA-binding protein [Lachnospiraceae bacterium]